MKTEELGEVHGGDIVVSMGSSAAATGYRKPTTTSSTKARITFVESAAGSGKTRALSEAVNALCQRGECSLIVLPSRELMAAYRVHNPKWQYIFTGSTEQNKSVVECALQAIIEQQRIIVITVECAERLCRLVSVNNDLTDALSAYHVWIDETPTAKASVGCFVEHGKEDIEKFWLDNTIQTEAGIIEALNHGTFERMANNGSFSGSFKAFLHHLCVGGLVAVTPCKNGTLYSGVADRAVFRLLGTCKSLMILGAAVERMSFIARAKELFGTTNIQVERDTTLIPEVKVYPNTKRITLIPITRGRASMHRDADHFEAICKKALSAVPKGEAFLYVSNHDKELVKFEQIADRILGGAGGVRLPFQSHGLNAFAGYAVHHGDITDETRALMTDAQYQQGFHHVVFLGIANIRPFEKNWLSSELAEAISLERGSETCFQALTRSSLRNTKDDKTNHTFVVMCEDYAHYALSGYLQGATVDNSFLLETKAETPRAVKTKAIDDAFHDAV